MLRKFKKLAPIVEWTTLLLSTGLVCFFLCVILYDIFSKGYQVLSWEFVAELPTNGMTQGGILTPIIGTVFLTLITAIFSIPFGICCAIYLNEYAENTWLTRTIRASIRNLSGVPSIIYGLFGLALFVQALNFGDVDFICRTDSRALVPSLYNHNDGRGPAPYSAKHARGRTGCGSHQIRIDQRRGASRLFARYTNRYCPDIVQSRWRNSAYTLYGSRILYHQFLWQPQSGVYGTTLSPVYVVHAASVY